LPHLIHLMFIDAGSDDGAPTRYSRPTSSHYATGNLNVMRSTRHLHIIIGSPLEDINNIKEQLAAGDLRRLERMLVKKSHRPDRR
jgi:hypothetical protein